MSSCRVCTKEKSAGCWPHITTKGNCENFEYNDPRAIPPMSNAAKCRKNKWTIGTYLYGNEGFGPEVIKITAIGEEAILARQITNRHGEKINTFEGHWDLFRRKWRKINRSNI